MKIGIKTLMALAMGLMIAGSSVGFAEDASGGFCPLKNKATSTKTVEDLEAGADLGDSNDSDCQMGWPGLREADEDRLPGEDGTRNMDD